MNPVLTRRTLLGTAAAGSALAALRMGNNWAGGRDTLIFLQPELHGVAAGAIAEIHPHAEIVELQRDIVRHWRNHLGSKLAEASHAMAYVSWAQAQLLRGLVREAGGTSKVASLKDRSFAISLSLPASTARGMG